MSLTPANLFNVGSTTIPTLFLEARVHGGPADEIISQLGLSLNSNQVDVALFTRTSGIVLIAGVGSYCAYRVCAKYLGKEFVWTLIDATRLDRLSRADSRLLHPAAEGYLTSRQSSTFYEERARKRLCQLLRSLSEDDKAISAGGLSVLGSSGRQSPAISHASSAKQQKQRYRLLSTRSGSPVRVVCTTNQLLRRSFQKPENEQKESASGLGNIRNWVLDETDTENRTLNTRKHIPLLGEDDRCDAMSDITSVSRAQPPPNALLRTNCCVDVDGDLIEDEDAHEDSWSRSSYRRSLCAESLCWNDEFQRDNASISNPLFSCDSSSNISELSAMKNLEEMWKTDRRGTVDSSATSLILRLANDLDDTSSCCGTHNLDLGCFN
ncbi:hypothetical protein M3Y97_00143300 [Aphelenchoides bicaudatus]|nr:hypothetical protein M3Y97_00143300 [Aphelenchoides bicaudatus]